MSTIVYQDGVLREKWDDASRAYTEWDATGAQVSTRPYTADENAAADASAAQATADANAASTSSKLITVDFPAAQAIINESNSDINSNPASEIKDLAKAVRRLTRKVENLTDGSD
jgi:hypothetical protein